MKIDNHNRPSSQAAPHRIVIVGGGAGGLELATRLGNTVGRDGLARIILVDRSPTHFWKPLLHEAASGQIDPASHQIEYAAQAKWNNFHFEQGELEQVDRAQRLVMVGATADVDGHEVVPRRVLHFDRLVLSLGSVTNFFGVPGAEQHALSLENVVQAEQFRRKLLGACVRANHVRVSRGRQGDATVSINVIGAGATGVELAAALRSTVRLLSDYRLHALDPVRDIRIRLIESGPRVLPALSERMSARAQEHLARLQVDVLTGTRVAEVQANAIVTGAGEQLPGDITIWAAGVAGPPVLKALDGLALNGLGQVMVSATLQTQTDPNVFAMGDCAACPASSNGGFLPPRAQVAHQQAVFLSNALMQDIRGRPIPAFTYRDLGTLLSFGRNGAVGHLASGVMSRTVFVEGWAASVMYKMLYRKHLLVLTGFTRMALDTASHWLRSRISPAIKLH
ncbi:NAD(P)/FAD-dependent oxidoreductase [Paraburkholderia saeva]|uniref:NADH dehydrogenase n=1 Tax=Paraburkholderia saeva TaxID=2777537 RepID=A0A9N8S049_9BURK|nr:NAD(P)/FAD-dependent oxidoreductase [Paraburkholderia saeva]CAG4921340.1 NADH dehydrogenase [Paraburkholderia saeva]